MAITLPIGIRIAAGLLASTIDRIGKLPQELPMLAVSLAGQAVRTSFRVRQEIAELATRGDELLSGLTGNPQEKPAWATFDDDEEPVAPAAAGPAGPASAAAKTSSTKPVTVTVTAKPITAKASTTKPATTKPATNASPTKPATANTSTARTTRSTPTPRRPVARTEPAAATRPRLVPVTAAVPPMRVTGDHRLSIAELKEELLDMGITAVRELLVLEESGSNRAAYLTLLGNRLTTLEHQNGQSQSR